MAEFMAEAEALPASSAPPVAARIATHLNAALAPAGASAAVELDGSTILVQLTCDRGQNPAKLQAILRQGLQSLALESMAAASVSAWYRDALFPQQPPAWKREFTLEPPLQPFRPQPDIADLPTAPADYAPEREVRARHATPPPPPARAAVAAPTPPCPPAGSRVLPAPSGVFPKRLALTSLVVALGLSLGASVRLATSLGLATPPAATSSPANTADGANGRESTPQITLAEFERIEPGMTLAQVNEIVGVPGKLIADGQAGGVRGQVYSWKNPQGSNAIVEFKDGKVAAKAQAGL